jgi:hypothetical protein
VQGLVSAAFDARNEYDIGFETTLVEQQCSAETTTLDRCIEIVRDAQRDLQRLVSLEKKSRAKSEVQAEQLQTGDNNTKIVIIGDRFPNRPYRPKRPPHHSHPDTGGKPVARGHQPGPFSGYDSRFK